jgi:hypothetical protein
MKYCLWQNYGVKFTVSGPAIGGAKSGINFEMTLEKKVYCNVGIKRYHHY